MTLEWALPCVPTIVVFKFAPRLKTLLAHITHKSEKVSVNFDFLLVVRIWHIFTRCIFSPCLS